MQEDVSCLAVKDSAGELKGIVRHRDLLQYRQHSAMILTSGFTMRTVSMKSRLQTNACRS